MNTLEITATSVEEAKAKAAKKLGVDSADIDIEVLEETAGLFGKSKVRVKATSTVEAAPTVVEPEPDPEPAEEAQPEKEPAEEPEAEEKPKRAPRKKKEEEPKADDSEPKEEREEAVANKQDAEQLCSILEEILELGDLDAEVKVTELSGRYVHLELDGRDVSYLVGRRGEVINALQYLMNVMSTRKLGNGVRVVLEGDSYRKKRQDVLTTLAHNIAEEVAKRGEEAVLDALPAFERRVVHKALSDFEGVTTYSEGEEPERRVVIAPQK